MWNRSDNLDSSPGAITGRPPSWVVSAIDNERGMALILCLSMLAIMSILGAFALSTSTTEIGISGNYRAEKLAFFAAERAVEYSMGNNTILYKGGDTDLDKDNKNGTTVGTGTGDYFSDITVNGTGLLEGAGNTVQDLGAGDLPSKLSSKYGTEYGANYYRVTVTGVGPNDRSTARIDTVRSRLYKNEDDTKLETGEGG